MKKWMYFIIAALIIVLFGLGLFLYYRITRIHNFKLIDFKQNIEKVDELNLLTFEHAKNAIKYQIKIYNENKQLLEERTSKKTSVQIDNFFYEQGKKLTIEVYAYDKRENKRKALNDITITWKIPNLKLEEKDYFTNDDVIVDTSLDNPINDNYYIALFFNQKEIKRYKVEDGKVTFSKNISKDAPGTYELKLLKTLKEKDYILDKKTLNIGLPEITDVTFTNPKQNQEIKWDDFTFTFTGGDYATHYEIKILEQEKEIINKIITEKKLALDITQLKENTEYQLNMKAYHDKKPDMYKNFTLKFKTGKKQKLPLVTANRNSGNVYAGEKIALSSSNQKATIYYTTDGTTPTTSSKKYTSSISVYGNLTIKAIAVAKNYHNSDVATFTFKIDNTKKRIYLSPSNQVGNKGVQSIGYTNESLIMNRLADVVEPLLKQKGFIVYRNSPSMTLDEIVDTSKSLNVDLHLALHSNASLDGSRTGVETYVYSKNSFITPLAQKLQQSVENIYYKTNPGRIHFGYEEDYILREINPKRVDNGILIEVAYHDNITDAQWILNNLNKIGTTIANTVAAHYGR